MKKLFFAAITILFVSSFFTSCTENIITDDDQLFMETQAIEQEDSVSPGGGPLGEDDTNEES